MFNEAVQQIRELLRLLERPTSSTEIGNDTLRHFVKVPERVALNHQARETSTWRLHDGLIRRGAEHVKLHALHSSIVAYITELLRRPLVGRLARPMRHDRARGVVNACRSC